MTEEDRIAEAVLLWEEAYKLGKDVPAAELCRDCPELAEAVAENIAKLKRLRWIKSGTKSGQNVGDSGRRDESDGWQSRPESPGMVGEVRLERGAEPMPGFRLVELLGTGGFGEVWLAEQGGRVYALKFIDCKTSAASVEEVGRSLMREREVNHPHILHRHKVCWIGSTCVEIMEAGDEALGRHFRRLRKRQRKQRIYAEALFLLRDAAEALDYLQQKCKLLHLDIKPANLLLVRGRCKVGDFGTVDDVDKCGTTADSEDHGGSAAGRLYGEDSATIAAPQPWMRDGPDDSDLTRGSARNATDEEGAAAANSVILYVVDSTTGWQAKYLTAWTSALPESSSGYPLTEFDSSPAMGRPKRPPVIIRACTERYAPPEAFSGQITRSWDQYGLALTLCELVTGRIPFRSEGERLVGEKTEGRLVLDSLWAEIREPVRKALSPLPENRYPSCVAFVEAVRDAILPRYRWDRKNRSWLVEKWQGLAAEWKRSTEVTASLPPSVSLTTKRTPREPKNRIPWVKVFGLSFAPFVLLAGWSGVFRGGLLRGGELRWGGVVSAVATCLFMILLITGSVVPAIILNEWLHQTKPLTAPGWQGEEIENGNGSQMYFNVNSGGGAIK